MIYLIAALLLILVLGHEQSRIILAALTWFVLQCVLWCAALVAVVGIAAWVVAL